MKKKIFLLLIVVTMVTMAIPAMAFAEDDHGADAHSASMSYESGKAPIDDESATVDSSQVQEDEDQSTADEETVDTDDAGDEVHTFPLAVVGGIVVIILVLVAIVVDRTKRKKNKGR